MFLQSTGIQIQDCTVSQPRRLNLVYTPAFTPSIVCSVSLDFRLSRLWIWVVTACNLERTRRVGGKHRLKFQSQNLSQKNCKLNCFLPFFLFNNKDVGGMFLRNVALSPNFTTLQLRSSYASCWVLIHSDINHKVCKWPSNWPKP